MKLNSDQLDAALERGLKSAYLVSGDEPLLVAESADAIRAAARSAGFADRTLFFVERAFDWDAVRQSVQSLSLFSERRLIEIRLPSGKPDKGAAVLIDMAARPTPDVLCLVIADALDAKAAAAPWVRSFDEHGAWVRVWPVDAAALPGWLRARARRLGLDLDPEAAQLVTNLVEGNLLAAQQEIEKLALLCGGARIDTDLVLRSVADSARYDVFKLGAAAMAGDAPRALRVLLGLKSEGVEPTLVLWALTRELRGLWQSRERSRLRGPDRGGAWNLAAAPSAQALARAGRLPLAALLRQAHDTDRIVKGQSAGDAWTAVMGLAAAMAGALQATPESGRVRS